MKTRLTELMGIQYPIIQGGMHHFGVPALAAAVSNAGGCGTINRSVYAGSKEFRNAVREMKSLTDKPFLVNLSLLPDVSVGENVGETIRICGEEGVRAIETAGTNPKELVPYIHGAGILHIHKVPGARYALSAEKAGCDAVTVAGFECAGHPGGDEIGSLVLTNRAVRICRIPVVAAGGYADGRGLAAALALGAEGVVMGTRFLATKECTAHANFKAWIVQASENDTLLCQKSVHNLMRVANNECARRCLRLEREPDAAPGKLMSALSGGRASAAYEDGDVDGILFPVGSAVGLIHDIPSVKDMIDGIMREYGDALDRMLQLACGDSGTKEWAPAGTAPRVERGGESR
ncbi:NAD(P)H-dependent flavin oxidoreductase [Caproicibacter sp. BJN0012]|uniref:NAD(P)H-dependent flavin oxidoreductase n=1 Tax=Caproicibacter sp. BJN0012 TaxID=3110227 RepID=UPI002E0F876A|nr:nitronate monooxygenase [Caproicibacter sp. BJN0012]